MIIAVDFDGTLHTGIYPAIGAEAPYAGEMMRKLNADEHYLIINTCRTGDMLVDAINWLLRHDIPFDRVNDNCPIGVEQYGSNSRKIHAHVYVDDKQVGGLLTWPEIYEWISAKQLSYDMRNSIESGEITLKGHADPSGAEGEDGALYLINAPGR